MWVCRYGSGSLYVHIEDGWRVRGCAAGAGGGARHAYPHHGSVMAETTRCPVRRQKCHNNGPWIVFAAPLQIPTEPLVRDDSPVISLLLRNSSVLFPVWKKHNVRRPGIRLCHFKHLISIGWKLFSCWSPWSWFRLVFDEWGFCLP